MLWPQSRYYLHTWSRRVGVAASVMMHARCGRKASVVPSSFLLNLKPLRKGAVGKCSRLLTNCRQLRGKLRHGRRNAAHFSSETPTQRALGAVDRAHQGTIAASTITARRHRIHTAQPLVAVHFFHAASVTDSQVHWTC